MKMSLRTLENGTKMFTRREKEHVFLNINWSGTIIGAINLRVNMVRGHILPTSHYQFSKFRDFKTLLFSGYRFSTLHKYQIATVRFSSADSLLLKIIWGLKWNFVTFTLSACIHHFWNPSKANGRRCRLIFCSRRLQVSRVGHVMYKQTFQ